MELQQYVRLCVLVGVTTATLALNYVCNPDDSINVSGLPSSLYYYAMQEVVDNGTDVQCTVTNINATSIHITGCTKDLDILLTYSTYDGMGTHSLHGGLTVSAVKMKCNEISATGVVHTIDNDFLANLTLEEEADVNPTYSVTSDLSTYSTTVGDELTWTITFPVEYILEVTSCAAYPGTDNSSADSVSLISTGGCNVTDELISHFTDNLNGTATATILAFKFYEEPNVFLLCNLKICPSNSTACNTTCSKTKRDIHKRSLSDITYNSYPAESDEFYSKEVNAVIKVKLPDYLSGARISSPYGMGLLLVVLVTQM